MIPTKFSHCCEDSEPHIRLPRLRIQERYWESPGNLTLKASRIWWQDFHKTEGNRDSTLQRHKQNLCAPRLSRKEQCPHCRLNQSVQFSYSVVSDSWRPMNRSTPGLPVHHQLPKFTQTHIHRVSDVIQPSHPLSYPSPPDPNPSQHQSFPMSQLFAWGGQSTGVSALASCLPKKSQGWSSEWTGWISLQHKGTIKSLLQHHSSKASILRHSAFFTVQLSHPYRTTGKTIALTRRTFVGKVMSLLFNMLSRLVITFLPRNKRLLISWLQSPSAVILEPQKIKSDSFHCFSIDFPWSDGARCHDLSFLNVEI